jgi:hypothetical protein
MFLLIDYPQYDVMPLPLTRLRRSACAVRRCIGFGVLQGFQTYQTQALANNNHTATAYCLLFQYLVGQYPALRQVQWTRIPTLPLESPHWPVPRTLLSFRNYRLVSNLCPSMPRPNDQPCHASLVPNYSQTTKFHLSHWPGDVGHLGPNVSSNQAVLQTEFP